MKKTWNTPGIQELTIQATAHRGKHHGHGKHPHHNPGMGGNFGPGSDLCWCQGGISPCQNHHDLLGTSGSLGSNTTEGLS